MVTYDALRTLLAILEVFRPALTRPGFANFLVIFSGWVQTFGPHAITQALVVTGVAGRRHHEAFHRFFSRGTWSVEVCFREIKQLLGFGDSSARKRAAVERIAPLVALTYTTLVLWFMQGVHRTESASPPKHPWYGHRKGRCFADILRSAQRALAPLDVLDPQRSLDNLRESSASPYQPTAAVHRPAA